MSKAKRLEGRAKARLNFDADKLEQYFTEEADFKSLLIQINQSSTNREKADAVRDWMEPKPEKGLVLYKLFERTRYDSDIAGFADKLLLSNEYRFDDVIVDEANRQSRAKKVVKKEEQAVEFAEKRSKRFKKHQGKGDKYNQNELIQIRDAVEDDTDWRDAYREHLNRSLNAGRMARTREGYRKRYFNMKRLVKAEKERTKNKEVVVE